MASTQRASDLIGLGTYIRGLGVRTLKALQVWACKVVHILQFRRCLFANLEENLWPSLGEAIVKE